MNSPMRFCNQETLWLQNIAGPRPLSRKLISKLQLFGRSSGGATPVGEMQQLWLWWRCLEGRCNSYSYWNWGQIFEKLLDLHRRWDMMRMHWDLGQPWFFRQGLLNPEASWFVCSQKLQQIYNCNFSGNLGINQKFYLLCWTSSSCIFLLCFSGSTVL